MITMNIRFCDGRESVRNHSFPDDVTINNGNSRYGQWRLLEVRAEWIRSYQPNLVPTRVVT